MFTMQTNLPTYTEGPHREGVSFCPKQPLVFYDEYVYLLRLTDLYSHFC